MANIINDTLNFGLGLFAYSREKIEELVEKMVEKGEVSRGNAKEFAATLMQKGDEQREEIRTMIRNEVQAVSVEKPLTADEIRAIIREELKHQGE